MLDRIDLHIEVPQVKFREITSDKPGETSAQVRERVVAAPSQARNSPADIDTVPALAFNDDMSPFVLLSGWRRWLIAFAIFLLLNTEVCSAGIATNNNLLPNLAVGKNIDGRLEVFQVDGSGELRHRWEAKSAREWSSWASLGGNFNPSVTVIADARGRLMVFAVDRATQLVEFNQQKDTNFTGWSKWQKLSGPAMQSEVTAGLDASGRVELFAVDGATHALKRIRQADGREGWTDWLDLGAAVAPAPVVARNATGQLEILPLIFKASN